MNSQVKCGVSIYVFHSPATEKPFAGYTRTTCVHTCFGVTTVASTMHFHHKHCKEPQKNVIKCFFQEHNNLVIARFEL